MPLPSPTANTADLMTSTDHAAHALGISIHTLAAWRSNGRHNLPVGRLVSNRELDVDAWLALYLQASSGVLV